METLAAVELETKLTMWYNVGVIIKESQKDSKLETWLQLPDDFMMQLINYLQKKVYLLFIYFKKNTNFKNEVCTKQVSLIPDQAETTSKELRRKHPCEILFQPMLYNSESTDAKL